MFGLVPCSSEQKKQHIQHIFICPAPLTWNTLDLKQNQTHNAFDVIRALHHKQVWLLSLRLKACQQSN